MNGQEAGKTMTSLDGVKTVTTSNGASDLPVSWTSLDPTAALTSPAVVGAAAKRYVAAGLSVIPIEAELGEKAPDKRRLPRHYDTKLQRYKSSWKIYQARRPRVDEIEAWLEPGTPFGLAVVAGVVSGGGGNAGLEIIDFDTAELAERWVEKVERQAPGLVARLVRIRSPRPGLHVYYRCSEFGGSEKLACAAAKAEPGSDAKPKKVTLIELKGEGGYCLVPPSPKSCHPRCKLYELADGSPDLTAMPKITSAERRILLDEARSFNEWKDAKKAPSAPIRPKIAVPESRPGDDFNVRGTWAEVLEPHGWSLSHCSGEEEYWCRPGKAGGTSASVNYGGSGLLHVFSTNAEPFEDGGTYSKFAAYTLLNCGGDYKQAAQELQQRGYGSNCVSDAIAASFQKQAMKTNMSTATDNGLRS